MEVHTFGQIRKCTRLAKYGSAHVWPNMEVHTFGQIWKCTRLAKYRSAHVWPNIEVHTFGQIWKCTRLAKYGSAHVWPNMEVHTFGRSIEGALGARGIESDVAKWKFTDPDMLKFLCGSISTTVRRVPVVGQTCRLFRGHGQVLVRLNIHDHATRAVGQFRGCRREENGRPTK
jgi:hypothetical protein